MGERFWLIRLALIRWREWWCWKLAWAVPERLVYFVALRAAAWATQGKWGNESPNSVSVMQMLSRWKVQP